MKTLASFAKRYTKKYGKQILIVGLLWKVLLAFPLTANAQLPNCNDSRATRMTKSGALGAAAGAVIGGFTKGWNGKAVGIGAAVGGGVAAAAGVKTPSQCSLVPTNQRDPREENEGLARRAPSLRGQIVVFCFNTGNNCRPPSQGIEEIILANAVQAFSNELGARTSRVVGSWNNPCAIPNRKVVCVMYGTQIYTGNTNNATNIGGNIPHIGVNGGSMNQNQISTAVVTIELYDNGELVNGQLYPLATPLANRQEFGNTESGQRYINAYLNGRGGSVYGGNNSGSFDSYQVAQFDAARRATEQLTHGRGWLPTAEEDLSF